MIQKISFYILLLLANACFAEQSKVIIDTDPGIDDAMAIILAFQSPEIDVIGLTSIYGNGEIDLTTKNCLLLCELANKIIPVAKGSKKPLIIPKRPSPDFVHGTDGFGNIHLAPPISSPIPEGAVDFIISNIMNNPHEVTLIALGPLTNLAKAFLKEPKIASNVKEVIIFAGCYFFPGNCSPAAEANVWGDPHAADIVFSAGWPLTAIGLNASKQPQITKEILNRIEQNNPFLGGFLNKINQFYIDFYKSVNDELDGANVHDALTIAYLLDRGLFKTVNGSVCVVTEGLAEGATLLDTTGDPYFASWFTRPKVTIAMDCEGEKVMKLIEERLSQATEKGELNSPQSH